MNGQFEEINVLSDEHIDAFSDFLEHYGTPRHSGRYPWGSGEKYQRSRNFKSTVSDLRKQGYSDKDIAVMLNVSSTSELTRKYSIAVAEVRASDRARVIRLKDKGYSTSEIGRIMGKNESSIRSLLNDVYNERSEKTKVIANILKDEISKNEYGIIDVGLGVSNQLGVSNDRLKTAIQMLEDDGKYTLYTNIPSKQVATGETTWLKVLAKSELSRKDVIDAIKKNALQPPQYHQENGEIRKLEPPVSINSDRVYVRYAEDGGTEKDGLIELRRGVDDISLKDAHYAQVRIAVDGTHYLKGMAMYGKDIPDGYDIVFNTNKHKGTPKIDESGNGNEVFKKMKDSSTNLDGNPFGASIKLDDELVLAQRHYIGKDGKEHLSALNIVSEEGNWEKWSKNLASQFLSKQPVPLAKKQLDYAYLDKNQEYNDIMKLTNPVVKRKMLQEFADNCDSAAVHLKAAALPRQQSHVILPFPEMKGTEIFAPNFENGEKVVLIRYPHGGKFELPELTVNNKVKSVREALGGNSRDAVGINSKVAERLSGADFDGDTVVVIPNNKGAIKTQKALEGLKNFDPKEAYPGYPGMKVMTKKQKGTEMGKVSNLITDMTLKGASPEELTRAVKHSMVVIDAEKHKLNWKLSEQQNCISALKKKYQQQEDGRFGGASTLISRAKSEEHIPNRKVLYSLYEYKDKNGKMQTTDSLKKIEGEKVSNVRKIVDKGIYVDTGEKAYKPSGDYTYKFKQIKEYEYKNKNGETVVSNRKPNSKYATDIVERVVGTEVSKELKTTKSTKMAEAKDARTLMSSQTSPYQMELVYADYANKMKSLANKARKSYISTDLQKQSKSAKVTYSDAVSSLNKKLNIALQNKPLERKAQNLAQTLIKSTLNDNPNMDADDIKKMRNEKLRVARARVGANKQQIEITDYEWKAIQAGAVSDNKLQSILDNTDMDRVKKLATPKRDVGLSSSEKALANSMLAAGYTREEAAKRIGVSTSTLSKYL